MKVFDTPLQGLMVLELERFSDERGFFMETYQEQRYKEFGITDNFVQDNQSRSRKGVLRGLHFQVKHPQAQLVTVMRGRVFDVGVDLRKNSETFGEWYGAELGDDGVQQIYMSPGFAHGFCVLSDYADLHYKVSRFYEPDDEGGLLWNDPDVKVDWPISDPSVNQRDSRYPLLSELGAIYYSDH